MHTELQRGATWIPREDLFEWKERDTNNLLIETYAHGDFCRDKQIHIDLRLFVAELMCKFPEDRHYLREALDICLAHANMAAKDMYPDGVPEHETDDYIKQYVADVVLNAAPPVSAVLQMVV